MPPRSIGTDIELRQGARAAAGRGPSRAVEGEGNPAANGAGECASHERVSAEENGVRPLSECTTVANVCARFSVVIKPKCLQ